MYCRLQISSFMGEIGDEFKIVVVKAIHTLCLKFPKKHPILLMFLSTTLREEGGFDFKKTIVDAILGPVDRAKVTYTQSCASSL